MRLPRDCCYIEGAFSYIQVQTTDGTVVEEQRYTTYTEQIEFRRALDGGTYRLVSFLRPCDANCGNLDPPSEQCTATFTIAAGMTVHATIKPHPGRDCTITFD